MMGSRYVERICYFLSNLENRREKTDNKKRNVWKRVGRFVFSKLKRVYVSLSVIDFNYSVGKRYIYFLS